jgi:hypothetical protein
MKKKFKLPRLTWGICKPIMKIVESKKLYKRKGRRVEKEEIL